MKTTVIIVFGSFISLLLIVGTFFALYSTNPEVFGAVVEQPVKKEMMKRSTGDSVVAVQKPIGTDSTVASPSAGVKPKETKKTIVFTDTTDWKSKAKLFEAMSIDAASSILQSMNDKEVKQIIPHIKKRNAAKILATFDPDRAARIIR